jgi:hypothetical protein
MKPNQTHDDDESLRRVLHQWTVDTPLPPRFQEQVWQRIARAEIQPAPTLWASLSRSVEVLVPRPKFAFSYVAALLVFGVAAGTLAAQATTRRLNADLGLRYVQTLDPYHAAAPHP